MKASGSKNPSVSPRHGVKFYGTDESLFATVAGFLAQGLVSGQPAIVLATEAHRAGIVAHLVRHFVNVDEAVRTGDLVLLDARETLDRFMVDGMPDEGRFKQHVGGLVARVVGSRPRSTVRAYGEMVNLLWQNNESKAAIQLEIFWNQLATQHAFALLCGYSMGHFYKEAIHYQEVCEHHAEIIDDRVVMFRPRSQRTTIRRKRAV